MLQSQALHAEFPARTSKNGIRRILSVDDEPGILFTRQKLLQNAGYEVLSAADGEQALHFFTTHDVDLVLLDFLLPGMDGGVVARAMKQQKPLVPVIIVFASPVDEQGLPCVDCFICKGQGPALLLEVIKQLLAPLSEAHLKQGQGRRTNARWFHRPSLQAQLRKQIPRGQARW
jgi:CheY-like chemotaxis protein